jgi:hypothetical protein
MKRTNPVFMVLFIVTVFLLSAANVWAQAAPAFDQQPSVVFDLWSNSKGKYSDNVKLINATLQKNITFNVYGYDEKKKEWTLIGTSTLKEHADSDQVEKPRGVNIKNFRWFAIHSPSAIKFEAQAMADKSNDVIITILDKIPAVEAPQGNNAPAFSLPSSIVLPLSGRYKENIEIKNGLGGTNVLFNVWGYDQKNNQWQIIGAKRLSPDPAPPMVFTGWGWYNPATDESVTTPWKDRLNEFKWIAVQSLGGLAFNAQAVASSNDIKITVLK